MKELFKRVISGPWTTAGCDVQYRMERDGDTIFLFFQCSRGESDWHYNFDIAVVPYKKTPVRWYAHRGFVRLWKSVRDDVMTRIGGEITIGAKRIGVAGYSQGAAIATLAHEDIQFTFGAIVPVQTEVYACPRVVWSPPQAVRERFDGVRRWSVRGDIVTMIPPFPYNHVGMDERVGPMALPWWTHHRPEEYVRSLP